MFQISILTLFPEMVRTYLEFGLMAKALKKGLLQVEIVSIRDFALDLHKKVDDTPYGGGEGMVLKPDVLARALLAASGRSSLKPHVIYLSPQGPLFSVDRAKALAQQVSGSETTEAQHLILVCGHYEGLDQRFIDLHVQEEISIGDYVLTGGELPALVLLDAVSRWIPGVIGNPQSVSRDSLEGGLLKHPVYTKPPVFEGLEIPSVLMSGNHQKIEAWRATERERVTREKRPDLFARKQSEGLLSSSANGEKKGSR